VVQGQVLLFTSHNIIKIAQWLEVNPLDLLEESEIDEE
jgi:hypothetical protein